MTVVAHVGLGPAYWVLGAGFARSRARTGDLAMGSWEVELAREFPFIKPGPLTGVKSVTKGQENPATGPRK